MPAPLIGVTTYGQNEERHHTLPREYGDAIRRAGGIPLLLTPGETRIDALLARLDGLILAGGGDICPDLYHGPAHASIYMTDSERDKTELALTLAAVNRKMPLLGICRGIQLLNIALGGALHAHLPDVVGEQVVHRLPPREPTEHVVNVLRSSRLAALLLGEGLADVAASVEEIEINAASWHHQAISQVAPGLKVVARAADGVIEAVESKNHPWLFAVQWHPELTASHDAAQQRLFDAFIKATIENPS